MRKGTEIILNLPNDFGIMRGADPWVEAVPVAKQDIRPRNAINIVQLILPGCGARNYSGRDFASISTGRSGANPRA